MNRITLACICAFFLTVCCFTSCTEPVFETLHILIQNNTDNPVHITLYPRDESNVGSYSTSDVVVGSRTEFDLSPDKDQLLCISTDLDIEPYELASMILDSIHISLPDKDNAAIKFTHERATGYLENIFTESSTWDFRINEWNLRKIFRKYPMKENCYGFAILEDKIIK